MKDELKGMLGKYKPTEDKYAFSNIMHKVCTTLLDRIDDIPRIVKWENTSVHDKYIAYVEMISVGSSIGYDNRIRKVTDFDIRNGHLMNVFLTLGLYLRVTNMRYTDKDTLDSAIEFCNWRTLDLLNVYFMAEYNFDIPSDNIWFPHPLTAIFEEIRRKYNMIDDGIEYVDIEKLYDDIFYLSSVDNTESKSKYAAAMYGYLYDWCFHYFPDELIKWVSKTADDDDDVIVHTIPVSMLQFLYVVVINECCPKLTDENLLDKLYTLDMNYYEKMLMFLVMSNASEAMTGSMSKDLRKEYGKLLLEVMKQWNAELI